MHIFSTENNCTESFLSNYSVYLKVILLNRPLISFFLKIFIYLFIWLCWVLVAAGRLLSCGSPTPLLWHACGI